jgi:hypothetical protein
MVLEPSRCRKREPLRDLPDTLRHNYGPIWSCFGVFSLFDRRMNTQFRSLARQSSRFCTIQIWVCRTNEAYNLSFSPAPSLRPNRQTRVNLQPASHRRSRPAFTPTFRANDAFNSQTRVRLDEVGARAALLAVIGLILIQNVMLAVFRQSRIDADRHQRRRPYDCCALQENASRNRR